MTATDTAKASPNPEEDQYLDLIRDILDHGEHRPDRTGTGTYSLFAPTPLRFSLSRPKPTQSISNTDQNQEDASYDLILPLLTTKRVFLRAVISELLWFIAGSTSSQVLSAQNVKIWDGNGSRAFLDGVGLSHREEGDLGPVYGFQWRHFGAEYVDCHADYSAKGVDQLAEVVRKLKENPYDRRIILSAWNPADLKKMALPPCHMFAQFYVSFEDKVRGRRERRKNGANGVGATSSRQNTAVNGDAEQRESKEPQNRQKGTLHTILYQRSNDMGLGVPFNIASYALLTHMLAHVCDLIPGSLTHTMGDAHVYLDHVEALETQIEREPRAFPTLEIGKLDSKGVGIVQGMEGWKVEDFVVKGYDPHKAVAMKMSV